MYSAKEALRRYPNELEAPGLRESILHRIEMGMEDWRQHGYRQRKRFAGLIYDSIVKPFETDAALSSHASEPIEELRPILIRCRKCTIPEVNLMSTNGVKAEAPADDLRREAHHRPRAARVRLLGRVYQVPQAVVAVMDELSRFSVPGRPEFRSYRPSPKQLAIWMNTLARIYNEIHRDDPSWLHPMPLVAVPEGKEIE